MPHQWCGFLCRGNGLSNSRYLPLKAIHVEHIFLLKTPANDMIFIVIL